MVGRGRTREFDTDQALDVAMALFWRQGYEGTSIADLTAAMGISPPSLYAAFGSKRRLFEMAADRYLQRRERGFREALARLTAKEVGEAFLLDTVSAATRLGQPPGCFNVQAALSCGDESRDVSDLLASRRIAARLALEARFRRAVAAGDDLPPGTGAAALARYLSTVAEGLNLQAAAGATRSQLRAVVALAMRIFGDQIAATR